MTVFNTSVTASQMASVALFCPQSKAPEDSYLDHLHSFLMRHEYMERFRQEIINLKDFWPILAHGRNDIAALAQGPRYLQSLSDWITTGNSTLVSSVMSGIMSLPLLVIIQIGQYFEYLEILGIKHSEFVAQLRKGGGVQGYCGGLPPAIAVACSKDERELLENAGVALRIALAIGAYGELGDDESTPGATTIVVRLKRGGQGEELVTRFPGAYISAVTDPKTLSIVGPVPVLSQLRSYARGQGFLVQDMYIRGKVHNPENADLAKELCYVCDKTPSLQFPSVRSLQAPVRSNRTGELLTEGSLTHEVVNVILVSRCEWYTLLTELAKDLDLSGRRSHTFATFGIGDCTPLLPFHKLQLHITKLDVLSFINHHLPPIRQLSQENDYSFPQDAVAVIGASCRLPGANSLDDLWNLVSKGISQHKEVPTDRFDMHASFRASQDWKFAGKRKFYGNFIDHADKYDNAFFRSNPKEALNLDPQQRILLELAYQAMESSGYLRTHRRESGDQVGCFIGASFVEYLDNTNAHPPTAYTSTGTIRAFLSGRISYYFGWSGPSEVLDTACSSSLVAINRACKAIQAGECAMALAGGVNVMTGINNFLDLAKAGFLSPTGQCKPFDESADGYCRSEGGGLVVLKLLSQAVADGSHILGVIPGVATNQGGLSSSITIPHSPAQEKLYRTVLHQAGMKASQVSYVEAHGTGTQAGDPLEIASIRKVFAGPDRLKLLNVGSLKGNIGHAETAAGVASLLKVLAMIKHGSIPPQASHKALNPKIPELGPDKMCISKKADIWNEPLLAAFVNSYGAAGSNCALLCCEGPQQTNEGSMGPVDITDHSVYPIIISAASKETLYKNMETLGQHLERSVPRPSLGDLAFTLSERRKHDRYCFTTTASEVIDLTQSLKLARNDDSAPVEVPLKPKRAVLAFGGQSKKNVGFEKGLYQSCPRLRSYIDSCNDIVTSLGFSSILPALFQSEPIQDVVTLQCGTFAMQFACAMCWIDGGLEVSAVVGHSFGELTALVVSGVLSLPDGLKLIASRASLMKSHWGPEKGTMLAVFSNLENVGAIINDIYSDSQEPDVEVACYNSPASHVLVGSSSAISRVENLLKENQRFQGIRCQRLDVTHGFHSKFTIPILSGLEETSHSLTFRVPEIPVETCTAMRLDQVRSDRPHSHARDPVYFWDAIRRIEERLGPSVWLEAGMNSPIIPMIKQAVATPSDHVYLGMKVQETESSTKVLSNVVINLWQQGLPISHWKFISSKAQGYKQIWLPPYQFQSSSHWLANVDRVMEAQQKTPEPIKREEWQPENPPKLITQRDSGQFRVHPETKRFTTIVSGHAVRQRPLCPASMYMESAAMAVQILRGGFEADSLYFRNLSFQAPLGVDLGRDIHLALEPADENRSWNFVVQSASKTDPKSKFITHAKGRVGLTTEPKFQTYERLISDSIDEVKTSGSTEKLMSKRAYGLFSQVVHYADFLQGITNVYLNRTHAVAEVDIPVADLGGDETTATRACETVALDVFIQVVGLLINSSELVTKEEVFVATGVENASMSSMCDFNSSKSWTVYTKFKASSDDQAVGDIFVLTRAGILMMTITGVQFTKILISRLEKILDSANPGASHSTPVKKNLVPNLSPASSSSEISSMGGSPPGLSRQTSITSDGVSEMASNPGADNLRDIISEYTGLSRLDISDDANIGDLGVDSLAAVELAEELESRFGKDIASEDLMASSYGELAKICQVSTSTKSSSTKKKVTLPTDRTSNEIAAAGVVPKAKPTKGMQGLLRLLSETSGASVASIQESASLMDIGIDSLSAVELKDDLEDTFSVTIEDDRFTLDSTVKEITDFLGFDALEASVSNVDAAPNASTGGILRHPTNQAVSLPNPIEALAQCEASFADAAGKHGFLKYWTDVAPRQDELLLAYICEAFQLLGSGLSSVSLGRVIPMFQYLPKHEQVMQRLLQILEKHNIIMKQGSCFVRQSNAVPSQSSRKLHEDFVTQFTQYAGEAKFMELTGPKLADCLSGKTDAVSLMFKGPAAQQIMEAYYGKSPMLATLTDQLATFLSAVVAKTETSANAPIRILEVGAGTGGTTARLAEVLLASGSPVEYTFTDITPSIVKAAKLKFAKYDWMKFETFNLEKEPPDSLREQFDVVIGTNCVHATTSRTASIGRLGQVLRKDGFIVLSEVTRPIDWYDIVFGLLDGWWLAKDGSTYPLQPAESWMKSFREAGFNNVSYSEGSSPESNTQRLLVASRREVRPIPVRPVLMSPTSKSDHIVETLVYKEVDGTRIPADVYLPKMACRQAMPVALMIHGGGHMTLSKKAVRPAQTSFLLANGILPISLDYRLCPEVNLIDGPMADVRDAYAWAQSPSRTGLQSILHSKGSMVEVNRAKIMVIGWSTGGHLAMTTAWTTKEAGLPPPSAILSFYSPNDFESGDLDGRRAEMYPERRISIEKIIRSLPTRPITSYDSDTVDTTGLGWVRPGDPRSELVLSLFKEGTGLSLMLNGLSPDFLNTPPSPERVAAISPMAQLRAGRYTTPTFLIHGEKDEIVPFHTAVKFADALKGYGVKGGLLAVKGAKHIHDLPLRPGTERWQQEVAPGYEFLFSTVDEET